MIGTVDVSPITRSGAQDAARHELSKGIYHRYDDPWPVRAFRAVEHWVGHVLDDIGRNAPGGGAGAVGLLVVVIAIVAIARWRLGGVQRDRRTGPVLPDRRTTAADHRAAARAAEAAGNWHDAILERMRAALRTLEERGVLDERPGRTAGEAATDAAAELPSVGGSMAAAARVFDLVVYGDRPADEASYDVVVRADETVSAPGFAGARR